MTERPDPLAPPEGYGQAPSHRGSAARDNDGTDLTQCTIFLNGRHCDHPVTEIWALGCTRGEHAGRFGICACHAAMARNGSHVCQPCADAGQLGTPMRVMHTQPLPVAQCCGVPDGILGILA